MERPHVTLEVGYDGVAVITMSNPPVNALALAVMAGLQEKFDEAVRRNDVKAIVLTSKGGKFSGGFDINVFRKVHETGNASLLPDVSVDLLVNTIEDCKKPVVAAVEGLALGGGLELAMGCHARVAAPKTQLALPELTLGLIPGFGGTQCLPRLLGLSKAIEMMLVSAHSIL
uniref:Glyoxysomal fatty acid beta-oxidation multifunctional protein MFP-a n=1 Tax=Rhizophora mucronata TaxID=61149 RepID=A0A2P2MFX0_RHIMU